MRKTIYLLLLCIASSTLLMIEARVNINIKVKNSKKIRPRPRPKPAANEMHVPDPRDGAIMQEELPFVVIVCTRNNAPWVTKNLDSIFSQQYNNFRVIYIDDASTDGAPDKVQAYIDEYNLHDRIIFIRNEFRGRKVKNEYIAFHMCNDNEIIVQLDGDDWYAHNKVLAKLNQEYLKYHIWLTYGSHKNYPPSNIGSKSRPTPLQVARSRHFRRDFIYMPTRSFYAWLVKLIKLEDLMNDDVPGFKGEFYPTCDDALLMWAMLEMAHNKFKYLPDVSYIANRANPNITIKVEMNLLGQCSKSLMKVIPLYPVVPAPVLNRLTKYTMAQADGIILSSDPARLGELLSMVQNSCEHIEKTLVVYQAQDENTQRVYQNLEMNYPGMIFVNIKNLTEVKMREYLAQLQNNHVLVLKDTTKLIGQIDCRTCIQQLERTFAYAVYPGLQKQDFVNHKIPYQHIIADLYAWKFSCDNNKSLTVNTFDGALYRKSDLSCVLVGNYTTLQEIEKAWNTVKINKKRVGLFYQENKLQ